MLECGHILFPYEITATLQWPANQNEKALMKKEATSQSARVLVALLVCPAACLILAGTVPAFFRSSVPSQLSQRTFTFAERVTYQRAIEEVYWRHRIWPKERPDPKPSLDAVMTQAQLEKKVADYLRKSQALEDYWRHPITAEQLQTEMDRMTQHTRQPMVLRELFEALGNDPFVIAECLARPALAESLLTNWYASNQPVHGVASEPLDSWLARVETQVSNTIPTTIADYRLPPISAADGGCVDEWTATNINNAPAARSNHTAVWTGSEMIIWGGADPFVMNTGARYNPDTDSWVATTMTNAPAARGLHTAVWTGTEMIVWGGGGVGFVASNTGGRYNPIADSWTATSTTDAPIPRYAQTAVWTGSEMIVWGGNNGNGLPSNTGGKYNPGTDSWIATSTTNAPAARVSHTAVWTGNEMIVWGGNDNDGPPPEYFNSGGRYNPGTNSWTATTVTNVPSARAFHSAVWTGSEMIVWGGQNQNAVLLLNTGGRYDPATNSWIATNTTNAPEARNRHTAVWTSNEMILWGGFDGNGELNTGGRYDPDMNSWAPATTNNAPSPRAYHSAIWTGSEMIVWGGEGPLFTNTGGIYCAQPPSVPARLGNISTRAFVQTGDNVMIAGFIVQGTEPKRVIIRAIGPELTQYGVPDALANPTLELHNRVGALIASNDNWRTTIIGGIITSDQVLDILRSGYAPGDGRECAIIADLPPGNYTAIIRGVNDSTGVALAEVYDLNSDNNSILGNVSTRSFVQTGDNVMIGGFIVQGTHPKRIIVRGIGPELGAPPYNIPNALANPTLELHDGTGALIASNDNWRTTIIGGIITANQVRDIITSGYAPHDGRESAIIADLPVGNYTAIVRGVNDTTGVALVEVYDLH
jgi:Galactose oxidase, central domain